jgi:hypothetical protein
MSQINYTKMYTIKHDAEVFDYGDVDPEDLEVLKKQWEYYYNHHR